MTEAASARTALSTAREAELMRTVTEYQSPLLRYAAAILRGQTEAAQDVVQDVFIRFHQALANGQKIANTASWLYRVAHNRAIDLQRKEKRFQRSDDITATMDRTASIPAGTEGTCRREACALAMAELGVLPEEQQRVLLLKIVQELTLKEVAAIMELPISTVHYHLGQGLKELARQLKEKGAF